MPAETSLESTYWRCHGVSFSDAAAFRENREIFPHLLGDREAFHGNLAKASKFQQVLAH
ncbi:MAG: hypothetical protein ABTQ24_00645 [Azonexus sp.]|jgi:hypothetical protein